MSLERSIVCRCTSDVQRKRRIDNWPSSSHPCPPTQAWPNSDTEPRKGFIIAFSAAEVPVGFVWNRCEGLRHLFPLVRESAEKFCPGREHIVPAAGEFKHFVTGPSHGDPLWPEPAPAASGCACWTRSAGASKNRQWQNRGFRFAVAWSTQSQRLRCSSPSAVSDPRAGEPSRE